MKFKELQLEPKLQNAIEEAGFVELTPIQERAIPFGIEGKDITGLAQTGTGKTVAFLVPVIQNLISKNITGISTLILAPTRELVIQIAEEAQKLLKGSEHRVVSIIGGTDYKSQNRDLEKLDGIIVATPGRLIDLARSGTADLNAVEYFILDEADRMLDMGFINDIRWLLHKCKNRKQTMLFSATLSVEVMRLAYRFMNEPVEIQINPEKIITERIDQKLAHLGREEKLPYMVNMILLSDVDGQGIIFTNFKANIPRIVHTLRKYGIPVTGISSDLDQKKRLRLMRDFKSGKFKYMVATDVASRGIDVENIGIVFNFDLPQDTENYVHRIGRTARAGRMGKSVSFCSESDYTELEKIDKYLKQKIEIIQIDEKLLMFPEGEFQAFVGGDAYDHTFGEKHERNGKRPHGREDRDRSRDNKNGGYQKGKSRDRRNDSKGAKGAAPHPHRRDRFGKKRPEAAIEEAEQFLQKADSMLGGPSDRRKSENQSQGRKKGKPKSHGKENFQPSNQKQRNYDKKKRNLFDINEHKVKQPKKKESLWKKIKSFFGS
ncbi:DEAD/DEAH box helicase [Leptospira perolatii]|uniref:DEAD/DEAH box helicase n=1 Tax=Leptospira perolatii TaxID=2023191 RepID=A0ABX4P506_9LEPT|nr:DEAD/DEAH box helicase [Leptospira perolatii]PJZ68162.1 DEAD/DEAH box helicase [Leptospira perolatii]